MNFAEKLEQKLLGKPIVDDQHVVLSAEVLDQARAGNDELIVEFAARQTEIEDGHPDNEQYDNIIQLLGQANEIIDSATEYLYSEE